MHQSPPTGCRNQELAVGNASWVLLTWYGTPCASAPSISRVLVTSNGVVTAAANPPQTEPHNAACMELTGCPCHALQVVLDFSYSGNWIAENGISRITVVKSAPISQHKSAGPERTGHVVAVLPTLCWGVLCYRESAKWMESGAYILDRSR